MTHARDKHSEVATKLAGFQCGSDDQCRDPRACGCVNAIVNALVAAERKGMESAASIARDRQRRCVNEIGETDGSAYWQGAASSASIILNAILSEAGGG